MAWNVTITVLTSVFGATILVSILYFIHAHLIPHIRRPKQKPDVTLPRVHGRTSHCLQESLYSLPSLNYIDPRNSVADTELRSSRWSTNLQDLSRSASAMSLSLPRSPRMHFSTFPRQSIRSPSHRRTTSASTIGQLPLQSMPEMPKAASRQTDGRQRQREKPTVLTLAPEESHVYQMFSRTRSKSDTAAFVHEGLLARSHAAFFEHTDAADASSPTISTFSGTTLLSNPRTPQQKLRSGSDTRRGRSQSLVGRHQLRTLSGSNQTGSHVLSHG